MNCRRKIETGQCKVTKKIKDLEKQLAEEKKAKEEVEEKIFELWRLFGEEQKAREASEKREQELRRQMQRRKTLEFRRQNWDRIWKNATGPLFGLPIPESKIESGRV